MAFGIRKILNGGTTLLASFEQAEPGQDQPHKVVVSSQPERPRRRYRRRVPAKQKRAPSGSVGRVVDLVLAEHPGSRVVEIGDLVVQRDPTISRSSVTNELRRKLGQRYRKEGVRWYRIGDPRKEDGEGPLFGAEPESSVGGSGLAAASPGPLATGTTDALAGYVVPGETRFGGRPGPRVSARIR
jgi:hypothetical protein